MATHHRLGKTILVALGLAGFVGCGAAPDSADFESSGESEQALGTLASVKVMAYYDANANGYTDGVGLGHSDAACAAPNAEIGLAGWPIAYSFAAGGDDTPDRLYTDSLGYGTVTLRAGEYTFEAYDAERPWRHTGNSFDQTRSVSKGSVVELEADKSYSVSLAEGGDVQCLLFGFMCLGGGGAQTADYWGHHLVTAADLSALTALDLKDLQGNDFVPVTNGVLQCWINNVLGLNKAYQLSVELAAMTLNVRARFVDPAAVVEAPNALHPTVRRFTTVQALMDEANASVAAHPFTDAAGPDRTYQTALAKALSSANANLTFVQPDAAHCPSPTFY